MTRHYPRPPHHEHQQQNQQHQYKERGWYCKEHGIKYLCNTCGYDSVHNSNRHKEMKYYFVGG
jgi:hypothetical protein